MRLTVGDVEDLLQDDKLFFDVVDNFDIVYKKTHIRDYRIDFDFYRYDVKTERYIYYITYAQDYYLEKLHQNYSIIGKDRFPHKHIVLNCRNVLSLNLTGIRQKYQGACPVRTLKSWCNLDSCRPIYLSDEDEKYLEELFLNIPFIANYDYSYLKHFLHYEAEVPNYYKLAKGNRYCEKEPPYSKHLTWRRRYFIDNDTKSSGNSGQVKQGESDDNTRRY